MALNDNINDFMIYINSLAAKMLIYLTTKIEILLFLIEKITILIECLDFINIF